MPARKSDYVLVDQTLDRNFHADEVADTSYYLQEQQNNYDVYKHRIQPQDSFGTSSSVVPSSNISRADCYFHHADKGPHVGFERSSSGIAQGVPRVDRTFSGLSDKCSQLSFDDLFPSTERSYTASDRHDNDRVSPEFEQSLSIVGYTTSEKNYLPIIRRTQTTLDQYGPRFGRCPDRTSSIESSNTGPNGGSDPTSLLYRQISAGSYSDSALSSDLNFPATPDVLFFKTNSFSLQEPSTNRQKIQGIAENEDGPGTDPEAPTSWAQQREHSYHLQVALARRLMAEAELTSETRLIGQHFRETSCSAARRSVDATAHRFWVNGSLGYSDIIQDGFYYIWGMNPQVWTICNHPTDANRMPSLESLRAVNPADSTIEVILVDKNGDSHLRELVRDLELKATSLLTHASDLCELAKMLGNRVCMLLGGAASSEHGDLSWRWKESSRRLNDCLCSIVLPLGSLSVGLCRHRALLFKTLADSISLPCRIARGCKYCGSEDGASCMVLCEPEREYYVDLIARPGYLSSPDSVWTNSSWSFCSPLRFPDFERSFSGDDRSWSRACGTEAGSSDGVLSESQCQNDGSRGKADRGPRHWFPSGSAELVFSDHRSGADVWAVMKVSEDRAYNLFKDQLHHRRLDGKGPEKLVSSGNMSFVAGVNPDSMAGIIQSIAPSSEDGLKFQDDSRSRQFTIQADSSTLGKATVSYMNASMGLVEPSDGKRLERLPTSEDWEIRWDDIIMRERVGAGSFGTVHRADWQGSDVAVKVLMQQDVHDEQLREFLREVSIMKRLRHPNVVLFMGAVTVPPNLSIVTEYLSRGSLFRILHKMNVKDYLDERRRVKMAYDVAKGMNYLHRSNPPIVHRDLKSPNLLVDKTWTVKVCDFGLSRFKGNTFLTSRSGAGTPEWMAPEVLRDEPSNEKSDVYSFGVVLWELITLQQPWSGLSPAQVVGAVGFQNRRLQIPKDLHPDMTAIIEACWSNDPRERPSFATIMELLKAFHKASASQPVQGFVQNAVS